MNIRYPLYEGVYRILTIHCQFRKEVPYNNRKTSKVITAIGGTGHDDNFPACTG